MEKWKVVQETEAYKNADVVTFIDEDGVELDEETVRKIPFDAPVVIRESANVGEIEVEVRLHKSAKEKVSAASEAEVSTMSKVIKRMQTEQQKAGMSTLDYEEVITMGRIPAISAAMQVLGIRRFTISSRQAGMQDVLAEFEKHGGWELKAVVRITNRQAVSGETYSDVCDKTKNAFLLVRKG